MELVEQFGGTPIAEIGGGSGGVSSSGGSSLPYAIFDLNDDSSGGGSGSGSVGSGVTEGDIVSETNNKPTNLSQVLPITAVTTNGALSVSNLDLNGMNEEQLKEIMGYFEQAIAEELEKAQSEGGQTGQALGGPLDANTGSGIVIPLGDSSSSGSGGPTTGSSTGGSDNKIPPIVIVTSLENGVVEYEVVTYHPVEDKQVDETQQAVQSVLTNPSALESVTSSVVANSQTSDDPTLDGNLDSMSVDSNAVEIFTTGTYHVGNLNSDEMNAEQKEEIEAIFEEAILAELEAISSSGQGGPGGSTGPGSGTGGVNILPEGASVEITSINNGKVEYQIIAYVATGDDSSSSGDSVSAAVETIQSSLGSQPALEIITASVVSSSQSSSDPVIKNELSSVNIESHSVGQSTFGSLNVNNLNTSELDKAQIDEVMGYFENAIKDQLVASGILPIGTLVVGQGDLSSFGGTASDAIVVTISSVMNGLVQYDIANIAGASNQATASTLDEVDAIELQESIQTLLSLPTTMTAISSSVASAAASSGDATLNLTLNPEGSEDNDSLKVKVTLHSVEVTTAGTLGVSDLDPSKVNELNADQMVELSAHFEAAISSALQASENLPLGSTATVIVTNIANGIVEYEVITYVGANSLSSSGPSSNSVAAIVTNTDIAISTTLSSPAVLDSITNYLNSQLTAPSSASAEVSDVLQSVSVDAHIGNGSYSGVIVSVGDTSSGSTSSLLPSATGGGSTASSMSQTTLHATTMGQFDVDNLDTTSMTQAQLEEAIQYFEEAIMDTLVEGGFLPTGGLGAETGTGTGTGGAVPASPSGASSVTVTSINSGVVQYEIDILYTVQDDPGIASPNPPGSSGSTDTALPSISAAQETAETAISSVNAALEDQSTLSTISDSVQSMAASSSTTGIGPALSDVSITNHTPATHISITGVFEVENFAPSLFTAKAEDEVEAYFENAISQTLLDQGLMPPGAQSLGVTVSLNDETGSVEYQIDIVYFDDDSSSSSSADEVIYSIEAALNSGETQDIISVLVQTQADSSISGVVPPGVLSDANIVDNDITNNPNSSAANGSGTSSGSGSSSSNSIIQTTVDDSGKAMTITITRPLTSFPPLDQVWTPEDSADGTVSSTGSAGDDPFGGTMNICAGIALEEGKQLVRPGLEDETVTLTRPDAGDDDVFLFTPVTQPVTGLIEEEGGGPQQGGLLGRPAGDGALFSRPDNRILKGQYSRFLSEESNDDDQQGVDIENELRHHHLKGLPTVNVNKQSRGAHITEDEHDQDDTTRKEKPRWLPSSFVWQRGLPNKKPKSQSTLPISPRTQSRPPPITTSHQVVAKGHGVQKLKTRGLQAQDSLVADFCLSITLGEEPPDDVEAAASSGPTTVPEQEGLKVCRCDENNECLSDTVLDTDTLSPDLEWERPLTFEQAAIEESNSITSDHIRICIITPPSDSMVDLTFFQIDDEAILPFVSDDPDFDEENADKTPSGLVIHPNATFEVSEDGNLVVVSYPVDGGVNGGDSFEISGTAVLGDSEGKLYPMFPIAM